MKLSHYTTITEDNIALIAFRLKQFIERMGTVAEQSFYLDTIAKVQLFGKSDMDVEQSQVCYLSSSDYTLEVDRNMDILPFIRINWQKGCNGMLIKVGEKIRITSNHIYYHAPRVFGDSKYPFTVWTKGDENACYYQTEQNKHYSDMYWDDVEREYELDL